MVALPAGTLRYCPVCQRDWTPAKERDLRSFRWAHPLPRHITVSNLDGVFHDGHTGRFLCVETKMPHEPELQEGQRTLLVALAELPRWTVRILKGYDLSRLDMFRVTRLGVGTQAIQTSALAFHQAISRFLDGGEWVDPAGTQKQVASADAPHVCSWWHDLATDVWLCVADYNTRAKGCGATGKVKDGVWYPDAVA